MTVCVDSNVALKWVLPEDGSERALALLALWRSTGERIVAPSHFFVEIASVLRQRTLRGGADHLDTDEGLEALQRLLGLGVRIRNSPDIHRRALELAVELAQPTTYDTHYVAVAEAEGCPFWTADERLYETAGRRFQRVHKLGETSLGVG